jgi:hypothetical protein
MTSVTQRSLASTLKAEALALLVLLLAACGAKSELEGQGRPQSEREACEAAPGAEWAGDGCGGARDRCGVLVCETINAEGCRCPEPDMCWDGTGCVTGESFDDARPQDDTHGATRDRGEQASWTRPHR